MSAEMVREIATLRLSSAEAFFAVTVHKNDFGAVIPTITNIAPGLSREHNDAMRGHLEGIALTLRAAYAQRSKENGGA